jgi:hypothetical protein
MLSGSRPFDSGDRGFEWIGTVGGMNTGRGKQGTRRKTAQVPLCPPQIPLYLTWDRTQAAEIGF